MQPIPFSPSMNSVDLNQLSAFFSEQAYSQLTPADEPVNTFKEQTVSKKRRIISEDSDSECSKEKQKQYNKKSYMKQKSLRAELDAVRAHNSLLISQLNVIELLIKDMKKIKSESIMD
jgi:hypothetical protein